MLRGDEETTEPREKRARKNERQRAEARGMMRGARVERSRGAERGANRERRRTKRSSTSSRARARVRAAIRSGGDDAIGARTIPREGDRSSRRARRRPGRRTTSSSGLEPQMPIVCRSSGVGASRVGGRACACAIVEFEQNSSAEDPGRRITDDDAGRQAGSTYWMELRVVCHALNPRRGSKILTSYTRSIARHHVAAFQIF